MSSFFPLFFIIPMGFNEAKKSKITLFLFSNLSPPHNLLQTVTQVSIMGGSHMSRAKGLPIKMLIAFVAIGLLLVPVVSAGTVYQNRESHSILLKYCLFPWQQPNSEPIQFPNNIARPYDLNTTPCDSCLAIQFSPFPGFYPAFTTRLPFPNRIPIL